MTQDPRYTPWIALLALCWLSGCAASFLPRQASPPALYTLDVAAQTASIPIPVPEPGAPTLIVNAPTAASGFDSARLAYVQRAYEIEYFTLHQWVDTPVHMLEPLLLRAIEATGAFHAVVSAPTTASGRFRLDTRLIRLQQDFTVRPSQVRLTLRAALIDATTRSVVAQGEFNASVASSSEDPYGGIIAAQLATAQVLADLAAFCAAAIR